MRLLVLFCLLISFVSAWAGSGPVSGPHLFNGRRYYVIDVDSWQSIEQTAQSYGGHLASINSAAENAFLASLIGYWGTSFVGFIGPQPGHWIDGSPVNYTNWDPNSWTTEPFWLPLSPSVTNHIAVLRPDGYWRLLPSSYHSNGRGIIEIPPAPADFEVIGALWYPVSGGLLFSYKFTGAVNTNVTAKLYWASGTTRLSDTPIYSATLPSLPQLETRIVHVAAGTFAGSNPPAGTTDIVIELDIPNQLFETNENNNVFSLSDVSVSGVAVTAHSLSVVKSTLRYAGDTHAAITSVGRSTADQARVMFEQLEGGPIFNKKLGVYQNALDYTYAEYGPNGDLVIDTYVASKAFGRTSEEIKYDMRSKIEAIKAQNPLAFPHTGDPSILQAVDIAPSTVANHPLYMVATEKKTEPRISVRYSPYTANPDKAFHLEIPQSQSGQLLEPVVFGSFVIQSDAIRASEDPMPALAVASPPPLGQSTSVSLSNRVVFATGAVSTGRKVYSFQGTEGDFLTVGVDVTAFFQGTDYNDDDVAVYLFDSEGHLLAANHHTAPFETEFEALLSGFLIPKSGAYYVAVTTFGNEPLFDGGGLLSGWQEDGTGSVEFELLISTAASKFGIRKAGGGWAAVEWPGEYKLEKATSLSGPWTEQTGSTSPHFVETLDQQQFFRLKE